MPYVSNCFGYDSYVPWNMLLEDPLNCMLDDYSKQDSARLAFPPLPLMDDIKALDNYDLNSNMPVSDVCLNTLKCNYEEILGSNTDASPRWMEQTTGTVLWEMLRNAVADDEWLSQKAAVIQQLRRGRGQPRGRHCGSH